MSFVRLSLLGSLIAALAGCATASSQAAAKHPYPREAGKPVTIPILGAQYTFPPHFEIIHYVDNPGIFGVEVVDRITGCEATMNFETIGEEPILTRYTNQTIDVLKDRSAQRNVDLQLRTEKISALNKDGRLIVAALINKVDPNDKFYYSRYELYVPEQTLGFHGFAECNQDPLREKTMASVREVILSQSR